MRPFILLTLIAGLALGCTQAPQSPPPGASAPPPAASGPPADVAALIARHTKLNDVCRGSSGDDPATMKACDERDGVFKQIEARGWCWGRPDQIEADKKWEKCAPKGR